jgi:hypothetical protein
MSGAVTDPNAFCDPEYDAGAVRDDKLCLGMASGPVPILEAMPSLGTVLKIESPDFGATKDSAQSQDSGK